MSVFSNRPERVNPARPKPPRTIRLIEPPLAWLNDGEGKVEITEGHVITVYYFREFVSALPGRAFHIRKDHTLNTKTGVREEFPDVEYGIRVHTQADRNCDCLGFSQWHHCRHVESFAALIEAGKLPCTSLSSLAKHDPEAFRAHEASIEHIFTLNPKHRFMGGEDDLPPAA
jgi:hypothetical protein